jgi:nucleoside-diphosphate-sugar epimerase
MVSCLIGFSGFVGKNISYKMNFDFYYNSKNINEIKDKKFDTVICCGVTAKKYWANQNSQLDLEQINILIKNIETIECNHFILISTIDVYSDTNSKYNEEHICMKKNHSYGENRLLLENYVKNKFSKYHIIRLPALFGFNLQKNILFDVINDKYPNINLNSKFQFYNIDWLVDDIKFVLRNNIPIINLFTEPIRTSEWINIDILKNKYNEVENNLQQYDLCTKYHLTGYWKNKDSVKSSLIRYIYNMKSNNICVSNLCFQTNVKYDILRTFGISKLEVAPHRFFGDHFLEKDFNYFEPWINKIYSFQSILYPETFNIFKDNVIFLKYFYRLVDIASFLNVKILVLGSPKNRQIDPSVKESTIFDVFNSMGNYCKEKNIILCVEPNSKLYFCNFLTNSQEGYEFVKKLNHTNIKLNLDLGCMEMENENIYDNIFKYLDLTYHIHFSAPNLKSIHSNKNLNYNFIYHQLIKFKYTGKITLETLNQSIDDIEKDIYEILRTTRYGIIGAGWYGCHLSKNILNSGYIVNLFEKNSKIFQESSTKNQNRLHMGFHYPRSFKTRKLCIQNYNKFLKEYNEFLYDISENYYLISNDSIIDFETYTNIFNYEQISFEHSNVYFPNTCGVILVKEKYIDSYKAGKYFETILLNILILNKKIDNLYDIEYDYIIDCTNNQMENIKFINNQSIYYELTISLLYESNTNNISAFTVVDGPFVSLFPHKIDENLYSLTHVIYTPVFISDKFNDIKKYEINETKIELIKNKMENEIKKYIPTFENKYKYKSYFLSTKCKFENKTDNRDLVILQNKNTFSIFCGKISGIYNLPNFCN